MYFALDRTCIYLVFLFEIVSLLSYFLFKIFEGIRIKEFGNGDIQTVTDFLDGGDTRIFALIVNDWLNRGIGYARYGR